MSCLYRKDLGHYSCSSIGRKIAQAFLDTLFWSESMATLNVTVNVVILNVLQKAQRNLLSKMMNELDVDYKYTVHNFICHLILSKWVILPSFTILVASVCVACV